MRQEIQSYALSKTLAAEMPTYTEYLPTQLTSIEEKVTPYVGKLFGLADELTEKIDDIKQSIKEFNLTTKVTELFNKAGDYVFFANSKRSKDSQKNRKAKKNNQSATHLSKKRMRDRIHKECGLGIYNENNRRRSRYR